MGLQKWKIRTCEAAGAVVEHPLGIHTSDIPAQLLVECKCLMECRTGEGWEEAWSKRVLRKGDEMFACVAVRKCSGGRGQGPSAKHQCCVCGRFDGGVSVEVAVVVRVVGGAVVAVVVVTVVVVRCAGI